jgi:hypothetical protein
MPSPTMATTAAMSRPTRGRMTSSRSRWRMLHEDLASSQVRLMRSMGERVSA